MGVILGHFLVSYGLLIFHAYEEIRVIRGELVHMTPAGGIASNVAKILSQPLISIQAIHPDPGDAVQTVSFMLGNSAIWATVISMVSVCRIKQLTNR